MSKRLHSWKNFKVLGYFVNLLLILSLVNRFRENKVDFHLNSFYFMFSNFFFFNFFILFIFFT